MRELIPGLVIALCLAFIIPISENTNLAFAKNGTSCATIDCYAPTLGIDERGMRVVSNGFACNGQAVNAEPYYTPYPLITAEVGKPLSCTLRVYDNRGVDEIQHIGLGFGLRYGTFFNDAHTFVNLDLDHTGAQSISKLDPNNAIQAFTISAQKVKDFEKFGIDVLETKFNVVFSKELPFDIVAVNVWDKSRNNGQFYFNDGIKVVDLNKPAPKPELSDLEKYNLAVAENKAKTDLDKTEKRLIQEEVKARELYKRMYNVIL